MLIHKKRALRNKRTDCTLPDLNAARSLVHNVELPLEEPCVGACSHTHDHQAGIQRLPVFGLGLLDAALTLKACARAQGGSALCCCNTAPPLLNNRLGRPHCN